VISSEAEGLFALEHEPKNDLARFAPSILLSHRTPTISFNVSAFSEASQRDVEIDAELRDLDAELEALALEPEEEEESSLDREGPSESDDVD
jgi:hypothetical protein